MMFFVLFGLAGVWVLGDLVYSSIVAYHVKNWEASIERDDEGVQRGCREYTIGSGETAVLLIHGINDSPRCYYKMAPSLAEEGLTCRVMRLPGFAEPIHRYSQATKEQWVAAVEREIQSLRQHSRRVAIVAHSLGGAVTIAYLLDHPEAVDAVVLLAPAVDVSNRRSPLLSAQTWHEIGRCSLLFTKVTSSPFTNDCHDPLMSLRRRIADSALGTPPCAWWPSWLPPSSRGLCQRLLNAPDLTKGYRDWCRAQWNTCPSYGKVGNAVGLKSLSVWPSTYPAAVGGDCEDLGTHCLPEARLTSTGTQGLHQPTGIGAVNGQEEARCSETLHKEWLTY